jgi:nucleotide-binding universal stress UspA family protein
MLKHILVPLDASPAAESVLDRFGPLLTRPGADVVLLYALEPPLAASLDPSRADRARSEAQDYVKEVAKGLSAEGVPCRGVVKPGPAAEAILAAAAEHPNGMIAMATHGRSGMARLAYGSVAESVLRKSPVPVLLVRTAEPHEPSKPLVVRRIMVPVDGSLQALAVAPFVGELGRAVKAEVTLIHVLAPVPAQAETVAHAERVIETARARFEDEGLSCESLIRTGDAAEEIIDAMRQKRTDLLACSTHGRTGIARAVLGSVAERLLRTSGVPMLVCRIAL